MKILKSGDPRIALGIRIFDCDICGCVFEAERGEYDCGNQFEPSPWCTCPCCNQIAYEASDVKRELYNVRK